MIIGNLRALIFAVALLFFGASPLFGGEKLNVAVAANFMLPFEELAEIFTNKTGVAVKKTFTSTGRLYGQITQGAPYDLFLAADDLRPRRLVAEGMAGKPFVYARGRVVLWSAGKDLCTAGNWQKALRLPWVSRIAIANPETAPYGAVPMEVLKETGLLEEIREKLVFAQTIAQVFQYAHTEAAQVGFCALSSALSAKGQKGCYLSLKETRPIMQAACILNRTENVEAAARFAAFLCSPQAGAVKKRYGYE